MDSLPRSIVIKSLLTGRYLYYQTDVRGYVCCQEESVFSPFAKIEVEVSKFNSKYVHLRFCHTNKYWGRDPNSDGWIVASSDKPVEDQSDQSCTLFEPCPHSNGQGIYLTYVKSESRLVIGQSEDNPNINYCLLVDDEGSYSPGSKFTFVDWDTLVKLPKYITFKGDSNGKYLKVMGDGYLHLSGDYFNHEKVAYEVIFHTDGHISIKYMHQPKFWVITESYIKVAALDDMHPKKFRSGSPLIYLQRVNASGYDINSLFWPVKLDDNTIALRHAGTNKFCEMMSNNHIGAKSNHISKEARLVVEELVSERSIYNVRYRNEDTRIYDEMPFVAGTGSATNSTDTESTLAIKVSYIDTSSSSFSNSLSTTLGVKTTIQTGMPCIVDGKIAISASVTDTLVWGKTTQTSKTAEATYTAKVPPKSQVTVKYVGTRGKCSVPFSYTKKDKMSSDGRFVTSEEVDGSYNGVNNYNYHFEHLKTEAYL